MMFGGQDKSDNVFSLLERACLDLAGPPSKQQKMEPKGRSLEHFIYKRMVWGRNCRPSK